ncbi:hypothetical protein ACQP1G_16895 [Nocardia sp. CA-107356]|uniref:hypothetical protein n=1 Tax=Nocardia sp. CA-107356 TaxID=3239972 RepID=UPI003D8A1124
MTTLAVGDVYRAVADELHRLCPGLRLLPSSLDAPGNGRLPTATAQGWQWCSTRRAVRQHRAG